MKLTFDFCSTAKVFSTRRFSVVLPTLLFIILFMLAFHTDLFDSGFNRLQLVQGNTTNFLPHRKLLNISVEIFSDVMEPDHLGEKCSTSDILIDQGPTHPLPSGIPTYTVEITNLSPNVCEIANIHIKCGWFSSDNLINPKIFKRLCYDDCLVNDGKPLVAGEVLSFVYSTTYPYRLSVSSVSCP